MNDILFFLHLVGLTGLGGGVAVLLLSRIAQASPPETAAAIRPLMPRVGHIARGGLILLWITGVPMVWTEFGGPRACR